MRFDTARDFFEYLGKLQHHDSDVVREFVERYEPYIRRTVRFRINRSSLQTAADSVDVCNSVLGSFLLRLAAGEYKIASEEDLRKLLMSIAKKKFLMLNRKESAAKRAHSQTQSLSDLPELASHRAEVAGASVEISELLEQVNQRMSPDENDLLRRRRNGQPWNDIERDLCEDARLLRKRLSRAIRRVADELGLEY